MKRMLLITCLFSCALPFGWSEPHVVSIDTESHGAVISPYVYGQFIEHLGRSVYGGLWAEMLEDRKFFYDVTYEFEPWGTASDSNWGSGLFPVLKASPWKVMGPEGTVFMSAANPFAGRRTPVVRPPANGTAAGISQEGLAVEKGRRYTGRIVLAADPGISVAVRLVGGTDRIGEFDIKNPGSAYTTYPFDFIPSISSDNARIEIIGKGGGSFRIGAVSLMPADNIGGWRRDVVELLEELDSPIYRWPGGNFVSGYDWRDGIGDRDARPPRKNPAWSGVEPNDVGIHEFMDLMSMLGSEAFIALNAGLGTIESAAEEVEYCTGSEDTPMGRLRAANGRREPFPVTWWAVGNEMFGRWQLGYMHISRYIEKHNGMIKAIRQVQPSAKLVGVGSIGSWDERMLAQGSEGMDLISEHIYWKEKADVAAHSRQLADDIDRIATIHRYYRETIPALAGKDIRIAMDEWNYWYGQYVYGELGVRYHLKDALGVARALHAFYRNSDIYFMANYAQTVNVIGAVKTTRTAAAFDTTGVALALYRKRFGSVPVQVSNTAETLDVSAALTADGKALTVSVVNFGETSADVRFDAGAVLSGEGMRWTLTGPGPDSTNEPGKMPQVTVTEAGVPDGSQVLTVPAWSATIFRMELR